jgi:hypothetical protein
MAGFRRCVVVPGVVKNVILGMPRINTVAATAPRSPEGSKDAALLVVPGNDHLTLHVRGRDGGHGALIEVYDLGEP